MSMNPFAPDVEAVLADRLGATRDYRDPLPCELALAAAMGVDPARLVLTNGGVEAIALVAAMNPAGRVDEPEFSLDRRHLTTVGAAPRWQSNPSNPLGRLRDTPMDLGPEPGVWDESFYNWVLIDDAPQLRSARRTGTVTVGFMVPRNRSDRHGSS